MIITFFGHRNAPDTIISVLENLLESFLSEYKDITFYVGSQGRFDSMVIRILKKLKAVYPHIKIYIVLAYYPDKNHVESPELTVYPEGLESVPKRFAIAKRNEWMVKQADCVITYVTHDFGGAAKFKALAVKKKKQVIEVSEIMK